MRLGTLKHIKSVSLALRGAPRIRAEDLVEGGGAVEHVARVSDCRHVPRADVLVQEVGGAEHPVHGGDRRHVPRADVLKEYALANT